MAAGLNAALLRSNKRNVSPEQVHSTVVPRPVKMSASRSAQDSPAHGVKRHGSVLQVPDINTTQCILHGISIALYLSLQNGVHKKSDANCRRSRTRMEWDLVPVFCTKWISTPKPRRWTHQSDKRIHVNSSKSDS